MSKLYIVIFPASLWKWPYFNSLYFSFIWGVVTPWSWEHLLTSVIQMSCTSLNLFSFLSFSSPSFNPHSINITLCNFWFHSWFYYFQNNFCFHIFFYTERLNIKYLRNKKLLYFNWEEIVILYLLFKKEKIFFPRTICLTC